MKRLLRAVGIGLGTTVVMMGFVFGFGATIEWISRTFGEHGVTGFLALLVFVVFTVLAYRESKAKQENGG